MIGALRNKTTAALVLLMLTGQLVSQPSNLHLASTSINVGGNNIDISEQDHLMDVYANIDLHLREAGRLLKEAVGMISIDQLRASTRIALLECFRDYTVYDTPPENMLHAKHVARE